MQPLLDIEMLDFLEWLKMEIGSTDIEDMEELERRMNPEHFARSVQFLLDKIYEKKKKLEIHRSDTHSISSNNLRMAIEKIIADMTSTERDFSVVTDFFEWFSANQERSKLKVELMPLDIFKEYVDKYCSVCSKSESVGRKILSAFKRAKRSQLIGYFLAAILRRGEEYRRSFDHILERYVNNKELYKCVILPLSKETAEYKALIRDYWRDLDSLSGNALEIYYSQVDYGRSGEEIFNCLKSLPKTLTNRAPSIIIWKDRMDEAKNISTDELNNRQIHDVIRTVVDAIRQRKIFEEVIMEGRKMADKKRNENRPIGSYVDNSQHIKVNSGVAVAGTGAQVNAPVYHSVDAPSFGQDINKAIERIQQFSEMEEKQKNALITILSETRDAVEEGNEEEKEKSKIRLEAFLSGVGSFAETLRDTLASIGGLAGFFGLIK